MLSTAVRLKSFQYYLAVIIIYLMILKKSRKTKEAASGAVFAKSIFYLHRREPCKYYARAFSMDGLFPYYYAPGSFPMGFHDFSCYNPMQARPGLDLPGPSGILASAQNRSMSPTSPSSNSTNSPSGSTVESVSDALDVEATGEDTAQTNEFEEVKQQWPRKTPDSHSCLPKSPHIYRAVGGSI